MVMIVARKNFKNETGDEVELSACYDEASHNMSIVVTRNSLLHTKPEYSPWEFGQLRELLADAHGEAFSGSTHPSHETRISDSSYYDEVCKKCGATDARGSVGLMFPCPKA